MKSTTPDMINQGKLLTCRHWLVGLLAVWIFAGCVPPPPYEKPNLLKAPTSGSGEVLKNTYPKVILTKNAQLARDYLEKFSQMGATPDFKQYDSTDFFDRLRAVLRGRFGPGPDLPESSGGMSMLFDAQVAVGQMSGAQSSISLTGAFIDSSQNVVETVHGNGAATVAFPAAGSQDFPKAVQAAFADLAHNLDTAPGVAVFDAQLKKAAEETRQRDIAERKRAQEARRNEIARATDQDDSAKELFKLQPNVELPVAQVTEILITWKNRHLDSVLRNAKTAELRAYVDEIEHTVFQATDASEKEKDEAQRLIAGGANDEHEHTDLARAYRLRIEVLKPILAAIKEESVNRSK